jgi:hypothetical protein
MKWTQFFPDGCGSYVYKHRDCPGIADDQYQYYPFHVPSIKPSTPFFNPLQIRYLFCRTWKAAVLAYRGNKTHRFHEKRNLCLWEDFDGPVIGTLRAQTDE